MCCFIWSCIVWNQKEDLLASALCTPKMVDQSYYGIWDEHTEQTLWRKLSYVIEHTMAQQGDKWWIRYYASRTRTVWVLREGCRREEGFTPGYMKKGWRGFTGQIFMNMQHIPWLYASLLLKLLWSFTSFWSRLFNTTFCFSQISSFLFLNDREKVHHSVSVITFASRWLCFKSNSVCLTNTFLQTRLLKASVLYGKA